MKSFPLAFLIALISACSPPPDDQDVVTESAGFDREAPLPVINLPQHPDFEAAWQMVGGKGSAPFVVIVEDKDLSPECGGDRFLNPVLGCVGGSYTSGAKEVWVTRRFLWWRLPHEFNHAAKFQNAGDADGGHAGFGGWDVATKWDRDVIGPVETFLQGKGWF